MKALKCARLAVRHGASWQAHDVRDPIQSRTHLPSSPAVPPPPAPGKSHNDPREGGQGGAVRGGGAGCGIRQCGVYHRRSSRLGGGCSRSGPECPRVGVISTFP